MYTLNLFYAKKYSTQAQHIVLFEIVSVSIYSVNVYLVQIGLVTRVHMSSELLEDCITAECTHCQFQNLITFH